MLLLREVLRDALHILTFLVWAFAVVLLMLGVGTAFFRIGEYWDRRGSLFSLRRPLPSAFSNEYYVSYRRSAWLGVAFLAVVAAAAFLSWLDILIFEHTN